MFNKPVVSIVVLVTVLLSALIVPTSVVHAGACHPSYNYQVVRLEANGTRTHISYNNVYAVAVANLNRQPTDPYFATHVYDDCGNLVAGNGVAAVHPTTGQAVVVTQQLMDEATRVADLERQVAELNQRVDQLEGRMDAVETLGVYQQGQIDSLTAIFQPDGAGGSNSVLVQNRRWNDSGLNVVIQLALVLFGMIVVVATGYGIRHWWNNRNRPPLQQQPPRQAGGFDMGRGPNNPEVPPPDDNFDDIRFDGGQNGQQREPAQPVIIINQGQAGDN